MVRRHERWGGTLRPRTPLAYASGENTRASQSNGRYKGPTTDESHTPSLLSKPVLLLLAHLGRPARHICAMNLQLSILVPCELAMNR